MVVTVGPTARHFRHPREVSVHVYGKALREPTQRAAATKPQPTRGRGAMLRAQALLGLQQSAGNRVVAQLLARDDGPVVQRAYATRGAAGVALNPTPGDLSLVNKEDAFKLGAVNNEHVLWGGQNRAVPILYRKFFSGTPFYLSPLVTGVNDTGAPVEAYFVRIAADGATSGFCDANRDLLAEAVDYRQNWRHEAGDLTSKPTARSDLDKLIEALAGNIYSDKVGSVVGGFAVKGNCKKIPLDDSSARIDRQNPVKKGTFNLQFQVGETSLACVIFAADDPQEVVLEKLIESFAQGIKVISPRA